MPSLDITRIFSSSRPTAPTPLSPSSASRRDSTVSSQDASKSVASDSTIDFTDDASKVPTLSTARLLFAHIGAALTLFLATTDATIVSTSLPTITSDLKASQSQYTWVGVAYMLTQTACQPLYGRLSDLIGRKNLMYTSMMVFALGSLLCGASKSIMCLILARGLAGLGGGGIVSSVWVITAEIVEERNRATWSTALSVTWSCSAVAGPLLGGLFILCLIELTIDLIMALLVYLNLPVCLVAFIVIGLSLRNVSVGRSSDATWKRLAQKFDFVGLLLFMTGTSCVVVGFSFAMSNGWNSPSTLLLVILGIIVLICGGFYEVWTTRDALFPPAAFKNPTAIIILVITFLHNVAFTAGTFYLALYFQAVNGSTPLIAGLQMLPYSLGSSLASMPVAWFIGRCQAKTGNTSGQKWAITSGLLLSTLGFGLMILLNQTSSHVLQAAFPLIAGVGLGMLFHAPFQVFTRALSPSELATGTSAFFLVRFTGATIGLSVAGMTFDGQLSRNLPSGYQIQSSASSINWKSLSSIQPLSLRWEVLSAISVAIRTIWIVCTPCLCLAMVLAIVMKSIPIEERIDRTQEKASPQKTPSIGSSQPEQV
ncbi:major facilitator superfamily domain-containing protein [Hygrophoropsis aurantiaca]|uniref:Major facilitator superfamily domain-containing protein n=1 Tax=Hygrophoropsis aurantiaca TaxID=72124 RepID=A0ACB8AQ01_9AGAM|nr:major facilitator superfamily domain-containing protein [Hygrophoropsis aurantiaca]